MKRRFISFSFLLLLVLAGCLEKYQAPEVKSGANLLVVDGFANITDNSARVRLARTTKLTDKQVSTPEKQAIVRLEEAETGLFMALPETATGIYSRTGLNLDINKKYRLRILTTAGKEYVSDDILMKATPPIDSVYWEAQPDGVHIYLDTHDPAAKARNYLWDFTETWHHTAFYDARYKIENAAIVIRTQAERTYNCWTTVPSNNIMVATTKNLSEDFISRKQLVFIPKGSIKVVLKYSIEINQQALTDESFSYWEQLKKTTENVGGLFDPLPTQVRGNMRSLIDPAEPVMGYFTGGAIVRQRIYINSYELPPNLQINAFGSSGCPLDSLKTKNGDLRGFDGILLVSDVPLLTSTGACLDCKFNGGTTVKPGFWP